MWYCTETDVYVEYEDETDILCKECIHYIYDDRCCKWVKEEDESAE